MGLNHQYIQRIDVWQDILFHEYQHHVRASGATLLDVALTLLSRNNAEFLAYIQSIYFNGSLTTQQLTDIGLAYPDNITQVVSSVF